MSLTSRTKSFADELLDHRLAEPFDIHRAARREMFDPPF